VLLGLGVVILLAGGCRNCPERFCKAVKLLREQAVNLSDRCCAYPESEGCGAELFTRFNKMLALVQVADDACHEGNLDLLKEIWGEFKQIVPANLILLFCETYHDLDRWLADECRPYFNSIVVLGTEESIDLDIQLIEVTVIGLPGLGSDPEGSTDPSPPVVPGERVFVVAPGSNALAETWIGSADLGVSGVFGMSTLDQNEHGYLEGAPTQLSFDFIDAERGVIGSIELARGVAQNIVLIDAQGVGMLGVTVSVDVHAIDDPGFSLEGFIETVWIELPIELRKQGARLGGGGPIAGLDLAPVHPETRARLETAHENVPPEPEAQVDPCGLEVGPDDRAWYQRSVTWYWRITQMFPECFPDAFPDGG
jgi:hypothetical protein